MKRSAVIDRVRCDSLAELEALFQRSQRLSGLDILPHWIEHMETRYESTPGTRSLKYTGARPCLFVHLRHDGRAHADLMVHCNEGMIDRDEALGTVWIPTPGQISRATARIRKREAARYLSVNPASPEYLPRVYSTSETPGGGTWAFE